VETIEGARLPILSWAADLEEGARRQARNCADLPVAFHHVAVMADGHPGYGVPIGAVLALEGAISPYAVGNDIGCGMTLMPTTVAVDDLMRPRRTRSGADGAPERDEIMGWVQASIPAGASGRGSSEPSSDVDQLLNTAFDAMEEAASATGTPLSTSSRPDGQGGQPLDRSAFLTRGRTQVGTLGSGNHFIELVTGPEGDVWLLLHSGSRGVGALVCNTFHRHALASVADLATLPADPALAWLPIDGGRWGRVGRCYERAQGACLEYARRNRQRMVEVVGSLIERRFPNAMRWDGAIDIHHNDATLEEHFGSQVWVHRKGAVKAAEGSPTITPGSMGTGSYLGRGRGNPQSFASCSHGAGRVMSRGAARHELSLAEQLETVAHAGGKVFADSRAAVLDEMPAAYKDLDAVMTAQADLVEPVRRFTPLGTYKGSDPPRRRRAKVKRRR
jgi:tRNA-splicing ligase RtcB (3'-phosphate/5'-hydroxy nucleic acid ligase)